MTTCVIHGSAWLRLGVCQACENAVEKHRAVPISREVLDELQRDAARYRWLRKNCRVTGEAVGGVPEHPALVYRYDITPTNKIRDYSAHGLDAAIDAAMVPHD